MATAMTAGAASASASAVVPAAAPLTIDPAVTGLAAALAVGLLIGLERGWRDRLQAEGSRVAGLRTFALIGLFGGLAALLRLQLGPGPVVAGLVGLAVLFAVSYREWVRTSGSLSATTAIAALVTFVLGALAASGAPALAVGVAVVVAVLLDLKPTLHRGLRLIEHRELSAALQLLVISLVVLPLLPDRGYGPYDALNPYRMWWAVVLVSGLSLAGHFAMRVSGPQRGLLWTGLLGGLASSTAATLTLSRRARSDPALAGPASAGTLAACGVMFFRMALIVLALQPALGFVLALPLSGCGLALLGASLLQWRRLAGTRPTEVAADASVRASAETDGRPSEPSDAQTPDSEPPFSLAVALGFGAYLGAIAVLTRWLLDLYGSAGILALAAISGLADVDAILITIARMQAAGALDSLTGVVAVGLAAASNQTVKAGIALLVGGWPMGRPVILGFAFATLVGAGVVGLSGTLAGLSP